MSPGEGVLTPPNGVIVGMEELVVSQSEELLVSQSVDVDDLRHLLHCLVREDCAHSWRNFGPEGTLDELLQWENERRPTKLFFFYVRRGDDMEMVAASAVADKLTGDFPHPGFCVLGRCYIMPQFRGRGFYRDVLRYRLDYCKAQLGDTLNAVHIGAIDDRIARVITNHGLAGWPKFAHLGIEELTVAGEVRPVGAYMLFSPKFVGKMRTALSGDGAPPCVVELRKALCESDAGDVRNLGNIVKDSFGEARASGWFDVRDPCEIERVLHFCSSIPLVGFGNGGSAG